MPERILPSSSPEAPQEDACLWQKAVPKLQKVRNDMLKVYPNNKAVMYFTENWGFSLQKK